MNCSRNEIVLLPIPFTDLQSRKVRPAIVLGTYKDDVFLTPISSQIGNTDFPLTQWAAAGLNVPCGVKAQISTVEITLIIKKVGVLHQADVQSLSQSLRRWLQIL
jgi:mRNA interferase MazF